MLPLTLSSVFQLARLQSACSPEALVKHTASLLPPSLSELSIPLTLPRNFTPAGSGSENTHPLNKCDNHPQPARPRPSPSLTSQPVFLPDKLRHSSALLEISFS